MCPADEVEEGDAEDQEDVRGDEAMSGHEEEEPEEARQVRLARDPGVPSKAEYESHSLTRMLYRAWCPWFVMGR